MANRDYGASAYTMPFQDYINMLIPFDMDRAKFWKRVKKAGEDQFVEDVKTEGFQIPDTYLDGLSIRTTVPPATIEFPDSDSYSLAGTEDMEYGAWYACWQEEDVYERRKQSWVKTAEHAGLALTFNRWVVSG